MAGYSGYSKSNNAILAEAENKYPLSISIKKLAAATGCTQKTAKDIFKRLGATEWHHTSRFYNVTNYYSVNAGIKYLSLLPVKKILEEMDYAKEIIPLFDIRDINERKRALYSQYKLIAVKAGCTIDDVERIYYDDYED